jgi:Uma2 family endonuclease
MDTILENILHSPLLNKYAEIIQQKVKEESDRREQFYNDITEQGKAEYIEGEIIVHSPSKIEHNIVAGLLYRYISIYNSIQKLGFVGYEKILIQLTRNDYEPDICFFKKEKSEKFAEKQMFFPTPDFIIEVLSESTEKRDRGIKFEDYALHGTGEYWLVDTDNKMIEQYILHGDKFEIVQKITSGIIRSFEIEGLAMPVEAAFDEIKNLESLQALQNQQPMS